jgi:tetratricopeptide (TPR) repeat protein
LAQVKRQVYLSLAVFLLTFPVCLAQSIAQPLLPSDGLKAEEAEDWKSAISLYRRALKDDPNRIDILIRISDIEARLGNHQEAIVALNAASQIAPNNAEIHFRLAQAYSASNQPKHAFTSIERSITLEPENTLYLKAHAQLANWIGKPGIAAGSYEKILHLSPDDDSALLNLARSSLWSGHLDKAASAYKRYLRRHPEEGEIYIEYARTETWRGNFHNSLVTLERYRQKFGKSKDYLKEKARAFALGKRPSKAINLINPLLDEDPNDYELNELHTIALYYADQQKEAIQGLETLFLLRPDSKEPYETERFVMNPLRPEISFASHFYTDSDELDHSKNSISGTYSLNTETRLKGGAQIDLLHAEEGSGLEPFEGGDRASHHSAWFGIRHRFSPKIVFDSYLGDASAEGKSKLIYEIGLDLQPLDNMNLMLQRNQSFYLASPRTVSLGIQQRSNYSRLVWEPDLVYTAVFELSYDTLSDDNKRWEVVLSPRRSIVRSMKFNLDCGLRGWWFSFDKDLDNGYYDPEFYQSYMVTGIGSWKISDSKAVRASLDLGLLKDTSMENLQFGWGSTVEGTTEFWQDITLTIGGGLAHNLRQETGAFRAYTAYLMVTIYL